jgi:hypothetical protein
MEHRGFRLQVEERISGGGHLPPEGGSHMMTKKLEAER